MTIKIFDVSNSFKRPTPRGLGGPIENDIVRYLKKYAPYFGCIFVDNELDADLIFTNDVFPKSYSQPKIKRMDGIYSKNNLINRNTVLNESANSADYVIFISEFSKKSLQTLYPEVKIKQSNIALNAADPKEFYPNQQTIHDKLFQFISTANDWNRPEKRGHLFLDLAKKFPHFKFALIGNSIQNLPSNVHSIGYISDYYEYNKALNQSQSFLYMGFNDPAPKTVAQALNCKLPLFLTDSGGNFELAQNYAYFISDYTKEPFFYEKVPDLNIDEISHQLELFYSHIDSYHHTFPAPQKFNSMLEIYFNVFKSLI